MAAQSMSSIMMAAQGMIHKLGSQFHKKMAAQSMSSLRMAAQCKNKFQGQNLMLGWLHTGMS